MMTVAFIKEESDEVAFEVEFTEEEWDQIETAASLKKDTANEFILNAIKEFIK